MHLLVMSTWTDKLKLRTSYGSFENLALQCMGSTDNHVVKLSLVVRAMLYVLLQVMTCFPIEDAVQTCK